MKGPRPVDDAKTSSRPQTSSVMTIGISHHIFRFQRKTRKPPSTPAFAPNLFNHCFMRLILRTYGLVCQFMDVVVVESCRDLLLTFRKAVFCVLSWIVL